MTRAPSEAVIEAVERAQTLHGRTLPNIVPHTESYFDHYRVEVARAAEEAALRAAAERMDDLSRGTPLAAAIAARAAAKRLDHWADELTDTNDRSKP